jgi:hypothetical protein
VRVHFAAAWRFVAPFALLGALAAAPAVGAAERLVLDSAIAEVVPIELGEPDLQEIEAVRQANAARFEKRLQIGIGRWVAGHANAHSRALRWRPVAGGSAAQWEISSLGAQGLRVAIDIGELPDSVQVRFAGNGDDAVYGPSSASDALRDAEGLFWSPVLEGDHATVELFVPYTHAPADVSIGIARVSHLFASPRAADFENVAKAAGSCEVDLICRSAADSALANVGKAVARMTFSDGLGGGTFTCTGTLLRTTSGPGAPYFYSANHCISTQASANTLTTHWFYDRPVCNAGSGISSSYVQLGGGATLLYNNATSDVLLLRLNSTPPAGAVYAGWTSSTLTNGTALTAVHHPAGDVKKVSLGSMGGFSAYGGGSGTTHLIALWNSTATGVTEGGSSGSGIFTAVGSPATDYELRGGLHGGPSSCSATGVDLRDYYSRFDQAYPSLAQYLDPATPPPCTYSISPTSGSSGSAGGSGSFTVTTTSGCAWSAVSNASWLTTSSSGTGSGTAFYSVAANSGAARSGTITVGGQTFTMSQSEGQQGSSSAVLSNTGFESGLTSWFESSTGGYPVITSDAAAAHAGNYYAWLGGYLSGTDAIYQDLIVPASADSVRLQFWYRITTQDSAQSAADTMTVTIQSASSGLTLATLVTLSNLDAANGWVQSLPYDLRAFRGQTVRVKFTAVNNATGITNFRVDDVTLTASSGVAIPRLGNLSTRMQVLTGNNVMIAGFIIGGTVSKTVVVNVAGPSLANFGVTGALANPTLTLVRSSDNAILGTNDNWQAQTNPADVSAITATGFQPNHPLEPALIATLPPGANTAIVQGSANGMGVGLIGVFEVDHPEVPLINISTRGQVLTGNDVMIAGFIVSGTTPQTVVVNVAGPYLANFGIGNPLQNPTLTLVRSSDNAVLATNDDWQSAPNAAQILASGFAPNNPLEPAILATLPPGAYTAIVSGSNGGTGVGLVGVFTVP